MRRGRSPTITRGPYAGDQLSVDHIVPFAVAPQLDHVTVNLELMPLRMNQAKGDAMGERQRAHGDHAEEQLHGILGVLYGFGGSGACGCFLRASRASESLLIALITSPAF